MQWQSDESGGNSERQSGTNVPVPAGAASSVNVDATVDSSTSNHHKPDSPGLATHSFSETSFDSSRHLRSTSNSPLGSLVGSPLGSLDAPQNGTAVDGASKSFSGDFQGDSTNDLANGVVGQFHNSLSDASNDELLGRFLHDNLPSAGAHDSAFGALSRESSAPSSMNGSTHSLESSGSPSGAPAPFQSIILNQVPRYERLSVDQPQKVSDGSSSYVSYLVTAQQYPEERPERVRRRYRDFARLYDRLVAEYPACAIPPLPDRWRLEYIAGDRFGTDFTTKRAASLERFLFRLSQHPTLRRSRAFVQFISAAPPPKNGQGQDPLSVGSGSNAARGTAREDSVTIAALDHLSEALMNAFAKARHQSKEMIDARERADRYEANIATIDKAVVRAGKTQSDLALDFEDMHQQALRLAKLEPESASEFQQLALTAQSLMGAHVRLRQGIDAHFGCALRDMSHYVLSLKGMLKQREQRQIDYEALVEYLKRSEHELVAVEHGQTAPAFSSSFLRSKFNELRGVDKEQARQQRITKLKLRIAEFKDEAAKAKQVSDDFEELAKREVRVFDQTEAIELQQSLSGLSDSYIEFFKTVLEDCHELEASLD